jgi:hypothetical protein
MPFFTGYLPGSGHTFRAVGVDTRNPPSVDVVNLPLGSSVEMEREILGDCHAARPAAHDPVLCLCRLRNAGTVAVLGVQRAGLRRAL